MPSATKTLVLITAYRDAEDMWWVNANDYHHPDYRCANLADMPRFIGERLAVLQMSEVDTSIDGVGRRISDTSYWLYVDKSEVPDEWRSAYYTEAV